MDKFSHIDEDGNARMVDITDKKATERLAVATAKVILNEKTYKLLKENQIGKGDVLTVAKVAGIMGAKNTYNLIPMAHPINLTGIDIKFDLDDDKYLIDVYATAKIKSKTGVEMEALTAASVAALTIYDMCKAVQKDIEVTNIKVLKKTGGKSGDYNA